MASAAFYFHIGIETALKHKTKRTTLINKYLIGCNGEPADDKASLRGQKSEDVGSNHFTGNNSVRTECQNVIPGQFIYNSEENSGWKERI